MGLKGKKGVMEVALIGWLWLQVAGKRKAAGRMEKTSVGRSTSVDFVPLSSASLRLLGDTWTATAKASTTYTITIINTFLFFLFSSSLLYPLSFHSLNQTIHSTKSLLPVNDLLIKGCHFNHKKLSCFVGSLKF